MAKTSLTLNIDDRALRAKLQAVKVRASDWRRAALLIHREMMVRTDSMFGRLRKGGRHRGVRWKGWAPQYTRKTDGVTVPAWGGVKKLRGKGKVLGRLRPSGTRVSASSALMQDTGTLRSRALLSRRITKSKIVMGNNLRYGEKQQSLREHIFFELPKDLSMMQRIIVRHILNG
tara:strand:+ start:2827 stop:3348 length:522 start_codon:yes stop_codon:yes gene_type:complete